LICLVRSGFERRAQWLNGLNKIHARLPALNILMHPSFADRESVRGAIKGSGKKRACSALAEQGLLCTDLRLGMFE